MFNIRSESIAILDMCHPYSLPVMIGQSKYREGVTKNIPKYVTSHGYQCIFLLYAFDSD